MSDLYDALIVGAGPGGATTAAFLARAGRRVLLVDKAPAFPRDKVCGDALSGKAVDVMRRLSLVAPVEAAPSLPCRGITFSGPKGAEVTIPFSKDPATPTPGYVIAREDFDGLVVDAAREAGAEIWTGAAVTGLLRADGASGPVVGARVRRGGVEEDVRARVVIGADGAYSVVARELGFTQLDERHYCAGLRQYVDGVTGFDTQYNAIELHFVDAVNPGYFWIFPMADGRANVGLGMLSRDVKRRGVKLKQVFEDCLNDPRFAGRFANATRIGKVEGWGLPLGSKPRPMSGDGWLLVGDSASIIDPFTGEGIGNAMIAGEIASRHVLRSAETNDASAAALAPFDREVMAYLGRELRISHTLQRLSRWTWLLNAVIGQAARRPALADLISTMFDDEEARAQLQSPMFYVRALLGRPVPAGRVPSARA